MLGLYSFISRIVYASLFPLQWISPKIKAYLKTKNGKSTKDLSKPLNKRILVHCASLGEYEQSRSLINQLHAQGFEIILSFYSASGYTQVSDNDSISECLYLPFDLPGKMRLFINQTKPDLVIFVKYEFWFNFMDQLSKAGIPFIFISMYLTGKQKYFSWPYSSLFKKIRQASAFFVQDVGTASALNMIEIPNEKIFLTGDNRIDSILESKLNRKRIAACEALSNDLIIYGSVYSDDIEMIQNSITLYENMHHLIVPHNVDDSTLELFKSKIDCDVFDSEGPIATVSLVTEIGWLKHLYHYARIAYIGGGFQSGIHNSLEALVYNLAIIIGPKHQGFKEIQDLKNSNFIEIIDDKTKLPKAIATLLDRKMDRNELMSYFAKNSNTSQQIVSYCIDLLNE